MMASSHEPSRLRQGLNPLTTSLVGYNNNQLTTPMSALSMTSGHMSMAQTPASTIQPYNPQQWGRSPPAADRTPQFGDPQGTSPTENNVTIQRAAIANSMLRITTAATAIQSAEITTFDN